MDYEGIRKEVVASLRKRGSFSWLHAEDVAQEVLILLWQSVTNPDSEKPIVDPMAWCKTVARNRMINLQASWAEQMTPLSEASEDQVRWIDERHQDTLEPERLYIAKETLQRALPYIHPNEIEEKDRPRTATERSNLRLFRREEKENG